MISSESSFNQNNAAFFIDRAILIQKIHDYRTDFEEEKLSRPRFISLIRNFHRCFERNLISGHITASAWIVDHHANKVLLVHHKKLNRWLQPGGHADGDENVINVAMKEALEETGLAALSLFDANIFDLDIHLIPQYKDVQAHFHYDIRFLLIGDSRLTPEANEESNNVLWVPVDKAAYYTNKHRSIHRMILKSKLIFK
jgi:8-oxo-dGTP pyrophosphatase MutT (NUDIX family)